MLKRNDFNLKSKQLKTDFSDQNLFLLRLLQSISDNGSNRKVFYSLLKQNLDLLNEEIINVLKAFTDDTFAKVEEECKELIALDIGELAILINNFPLGNRAVNIEISITCYKILLTIFTDTKAPDIWATTQNNLANSYGDRVRGDRSDNIEMAITGYQNALAIFTPSTFPKEWVGAQNNLALAYQNRIKGDASDNIEKAIIRYQAILKNISPDWHPEEWAKTINNLANAFMKRIEGYRADNIEMAIDMYQGTLVIRTLEKSPVEWATTQSNLARAYGERIRGDETENLQQSINYYQLALGVLTINSFPNEWTSIQLELSKLSIEKMHNYQMAMEHLEAAYEHLSVNNSDTGLLAQTMFNMARCFHQTGSLDQAKIYFKDAIRIYQRLEQPTEVAAATSALGNLELQMGLTQDAQQHLQTALEFYQAAGQTDHIASIQALQQHLPIKLREIAS
jgi:tetratricopeptide (TPR) repeat protein